MAKAKQDGIYTLDGARFLIRKGDEMPEGAEFAANEPETPEADGADKTTKQAKTGPAETTDAVATPAETA